MENSTQQATVFIQMLSSLRNDWCLIEYY